MSVVSDEIVETVQIMNARGNQASDIVWDIAVDYSRNWDLSERIKLAWRIVRGGRP
jgi:hypothetical protein